MGDLATAPIPTTFSWPFDGDCSRLDTALLVIAAGGRIDQLGDSVSVKR
jgi:hypothetical protein